MSQAKIIESENGQKPQGEGWYVINLAEAEWTRSPHFGSFFSFEGDVRFDQVGVNVHVLQPGQPACKYHSEQMQEAFLVLRGECLLIVDEEERPMRAWDFFHCPPGVKHVFVGAGDGPCAILMIGSRAGDAGLHYPASEVARKYGASVEESTPDPRVAYEGLGDSSTSSSVFPSE